MLDISLELSGVTSKPVRTSHSVESRERRRSTDSDKDYDFSKLSKNSSQYNFNRKASQLSFVNPTRKDSAVIEDFSPK